MVGNMLVHAHLTHSVLCSIPVFSATGTDSRLENFTCMECIYTTSAYQHCFRQLTTLECS